MGGSGWGGEGCLVLTGFLVWEGLPSIHGVQQVGGTHRAVAVAVLIGYGLSVAAEEAARSLWAGHCSGWPGSAAGPWLHTHLAPRL